VGQHGENISTLRCTQKRLQTLSKMFPSITGSIFGVTASPRVLPSTTPLVTVEGEAYATYRMVPFPMTLNDPLIHISKSRQYSTLNMSSTLKLKTHNYLGLQWLLYTSARPVSTGQLQRSRRSLDTESAATLVHTTRIWTLYIN